MKTARIAVALSLLVLTACPQPPPPVAPDAPAGVTATATVRSATVLWSAPGQDGGRAILRYTVTAAPGGASAQVDGSATQAVVSGLANGTSYTFTVMATNEVGDSPPSGASAPVTTPDLPGAPRSVSATAQLRSAQVSWTAPASDGGSRVLQYAVTAAPGGAMATVDAPATSAVVSGLSDGTRYTFSVAAINAVGNSPAGTSAAVTTHDRPTPPLAPTAVPGVRSAQVSWSAPASDGGAPVNGYRVTALPGGASANVDAAMRSAAVTGLMDDTAYTFTVEAINAVGNSPPSVPTSAVTTHRVPDPPTGVAATGGLQAALVTWSAPASNGGSPVLGYRVTAAPGGAYADVAETSLSATVTGLMDGTTYTFTVVAISAVGNSPPSAPSPQASTHRIPDPPTGVAATGGVQSAVVTWTVPASNGGSAITGYQVTASPGGAVTTAPAGSTQATISGLANGTTYTFEVTARNAVGLSPPGRSNPATTARPPDAPGAASATAGVRSATVTWTPPPSDGGAPITGYQVAATPGSATVSAGPTATSILFDNLPSTADVSFTVLAINGAGNSPPSLASAPVRPLPAPAEVPAFAPAAGAGGGCVPIAYSLRQPDSVRADVAIELATSPGGPFRLATLAASASGSGRTGLATGPSGAAHTFPWNSSRDLPRTNTSQAFLRITAQVPGTSAATVTTAAVTVSNNFAFAAPVTTPGGSDPAALVSGDFNRDGRLDVAIANRGDNSVTILSGDGQGGFSPPTIAAAGTGPAGLAAGDLNGDAKLDLVVANRAGGDLSLLLGDGLGGFSAGTPLSPGATPSDVAVADVTRDGKADVVVAVLAPLGILTFPGRGDGTFLAPVSTALAAVGDTARDVRLADFNRDGRLDVAVATSSSTEGAAQLRAGDGTGAFPTALGTLAITSGITSRIALADANLDGRMDVIASSRSSGIVSVFVSNAGGTSYTELGLPVPAAVAAVAVADLNGDSLTDVLALDITGAVQVLMGSGGGRLMPSGVLGAVAGSADLVAGDLSRDGQVELIAAVRSGFAVWLNARKPDCGAELAAPTVSRYPRQFSVPMEMDEDGILDLVDVPISGSTYTHVNLGQGNGTYELFTFDNIGIYVTGTVTGDFDRDGHQDLAVSDGNQDGVRVHFGGGNGAFRLFYSGASSGFGTRPAGVAAGDLDGDGLLELVTANRGTGDASVLKGETGGTFTLLGRYAAMADPSAVALADLNADGRLDLLVANRTGNNVSIRLGNGDGTFSATRTNVGSGTSPVALVAARVNGDAHLDLVVANTGSYDLSLLMGRGDGSFLPAVSLPMEGTDQAPQDLTARDLNGDGREDLLTANGSQVNVFLSNGDGTFQPRARYGLGSFASTVEVADLNGDGIADIAAAGGALLGRGDGTFLAPGVMPLGPDSLASATGDLNGDGNTDVVLMTTLVSSRVLVLFSNGDGTLRPPVAHGLIAAASFIAVADLNRDGALDVVAAGGDRMHVLLNTGAGDLAIPVTYLSRPGTRSIQAADFDGDGDLDLVAASTQDGVVVLWPGNGDGTFQGARTFAGGQSPLRLAAGDFNRDGYLDLVTAGYSQYFVLIGNGNGTFQGPVSNTTGIAASAIRTEDLDHDGKLDLAILSSSGGVTMYLGLGDGDFLYGGSVSTGTSSAELTLADLDGDGWLDLVSNDSSYGAVVVRARPGNGFDPPVVYAPGTFATTSVAVLDLNRDGRLDVFASRNEGALLLRR